MGPAATEGDRVLYPPPGLWLWWSPSHGNGYTGAVGFVKKQNKRKNNAFLPLEVN